jgi:excisionase family DNA binding protein
MKYLTAEEIAAELRVDISSVRRWLRSGELASVRIGRQYRVERTVYEAFVKSREVPRQQDSGPKANDLVFAH